MIQVVIFDFDGTIANTLDSILELFNEVAPKYSLPVIQGSDKEKIRTFSAQELVKEYRVSPLKLLQLTRDILPKLKKNIENITPVEGIPEVLRKLKKQGIKIGIVTSNSPENVELFLNCHGISEIEFIHSEKNLFGKDKVLRHVIQKQKLDKQKVVYVGDEVRDIEAARKAGISIMAVTWGFNSRERLQKSNPDYLVDTPDQILIQI